MRFVCILANARTGSSHLTRLLHSCVGVNMKSEIFHRRLRGLVDDAELEALRGKSAGAIIDTSTLCDWRAQNPGLTLEILHEAGGGAPLIFKLFPGHISKELIVGEIFSRPDMAFIYLRRRPIDSFISSIKAKILTYHGEADTTRMKPRLSIDEFVKWARSMRSWHDWLEAEIAARKLALVRIGYENDLETSEPARLLQKVLTELETHGLPPLRPKSRLFVGTRQDREDHYRNRVANWPEFEAAAQRNPKTARLLDWAEAIP